MPGYTYGGKTGEKLSILHNEEIWFLKFPQNLEIQQTTLSYSTAPVSEYLGSEIYKTLGIDTHKTELGIYRNKPVVACRDFNKTEYQFYEFRGLLNTITSLSSAKFGKNASLNHVELSSVFEKIDNIFAPPIQEKMKKRFWDMFVVDAFINNKDRNTGNWGYFMNLTGDFIDLAPVYDNGSSFFPKTSEERFSNDNFLNSVIYNGNTPFMDNGKKVDSISAIRNPYFSNDEFNKSLTSAIKRIVPKINKKMSSFQDIIKKIPTDYNDIVFISEAQKKFYSKFLFQRYKLILEPALNKAMKGEKEISFTVSKPTGKGLER